MRVMDYVLDFFAVTTAGERERIERLRIRRVTIETAEQFARAYVKNVLFQGRRADVCQVKSQAGMMLREVIYDDFAWERTPAAEEAMAQFAHTGAAGVTH
jgi:hypothetical protein